VLALLLRDAMRQIRVICMPPGARLAAQMIAQNRRSVRRWSRSRITFRN
jgi:hypothetical protein